MSVRNDRELCFIFLIIIKCHGSCQRLYLEFVITQVCKQGIRESKSRSYPAGPARRDSRDVFI